MQGTATVRNGPDPDVALESGGNNIETQLWRRQQDEPSNGKDDVSRYTRPTVLVFSDNCDGHTRPFLTACVPAVADTHVLLFRCGSIFLTLSAKKVKSNVDNVLKETTSFLLLTTINLSIVSQRTPLHPHHEEYDETTNSQKPTGTIPVYVRMDGSIDIRVLALSCHLFGAQRSDENRNRCGIFDERRIPPATL